MYFCYVTLGFSISSRVSFLAVPTDFFIYLCVLACVTAQIRGIFTGAVQWIGAAAWSCQGFVVVCLLVVASGSLILLSVYQDYSLGFLHVVIPRYASKSYSDILFPRLCFVLSMGLYRKIKSKPYCKH